jgi:hypothetical protein
LIIDRSPVTTDVFPCLNFVNNSVDSSDQIWPGLICCVGTYQFRDCIFIANTIDFLVGARVNENGTVTQLRCTFDQSQLSTIGAITLTLPVKTKE